MYIICSQQVPPRWRWTMCLWMTMSHLFVFFCHRCVPHSMNGRTFWSSRGFSQQIKNWPKPGINVPLGAYDQKCYIMSYTRTLPFAAVTCSAPVVVPRTLPTKVPERPSMERKSFERKSWADMWGCPVLVTAFFDGWDLHKNGGERERERSRIFFGR